MRVVFDTNIFISALVFPSGQGGLALARIISGQDELIMSKPILDELLTVLARKFKRDTEGLSRLAIWLSDLASWTRPTVVLAVMADQPDNRILECAISGQATHLVTGDKDLLRLRDFEGVRIVSLRDYLSAPTG